MQLVKFKTENQKKKKKQKNRGITHLAKVHLRGPLSQPTKSLAWIPFLYPTDRRDPRGGGDHLLPLHLREVDTLATSSTSPSAIKIDPGVQRSVLIFFETFASRIKEVPAQRQCHRCHRI
jgi:hypothetical protein